LKVAVLPIEHVVSTPQTWIVTTTVPTTVVFCEGRCPDALAVIDAPALMYGRRSTPGSGGIEIVDVAGTESSLAITTSGKLAPELAATEMVIELRKSNVCPAGDVTVRVNELRLADLAGPVPCAAVSDWRSILRGMAKRVAGTREPRGLPVIVWAGMSWLTSKERIPHAGMEADSMATSAHPTNDE
jgi:hypothetical protein